MSKSVYSLVLSDDIVRAVDALAYKMNTSRSGLIDRILAEKLSVQTPEVRMRGLIDSITQMFDDDIFRLQTGVGGMLIKSPLSYKYKPTIRYAMDLSPDGTELGRLSVSFRTQNAVLSALINRFWRIFIAVEAKYLSGIFKIEYLLDNDKLTRTLKVPIRCSDGSSVTTDEAAKAAADYIRFIDGLIKLYFESTPDDEEAALMIDKAYSERMKTAKIIL